MLLFLPLALVEKDAADPAQTIMAADDVDGAMGMVVVDAFSVDAFVRDWVAMALDTPDEAGGLPRLHTGRSDRIAGKMIETDRDWKIRRSSAEQSNTSIRIGEDAILKVIRKLEEGQHPEIEIGRFLTAGSRFNATPALLSWTEMQGQDGTTALSVLQEFVPNDGDGWSWTLKQLERIGRSEAEDGSTSLAWLRRLGARTAELHRALSDQADNPDFRPEIAGPDDLGAWQAAAEKIAQRALDAAARIDEQATPELRSLAAALIDSGPRIAAALASLLRDIPPFARTRHHGDFHLGQALVAGEDAIIVDFEGEPLRSLQERRARNAVLRDVAGILRSLAYAEAAASRALPSDMRSEIRGAALTRLEQWRATAAGAFLDAYFAAAAGTPSCPADRTAAERLVRFFMLEKALYEVVYELANRPDWAGIPIAGVLDLVDETVAATRAHAMPFGAEVRSDGTVRFRLWAPSHDRVLIELLGHPEPVPMQQVGLGWHELVTGEAKNGGRYRFVLPDGLRVPDPASRFQPDDVHEPSEVIDPRTYQWQDAAWTGRPWSEAVAYELHIGAFTPEGTFTAATGKLDHLVELGVTAMEIMPISDFPGARNWGYDGVLPFAPDSSYGRPEDLKGLIDAAHARGLMVLLDVVYNHFGPEGAYQHAVTPQMFTDRHETPWGKAINTDPVEAGPLREYFVHNAIYWIEEYHFDGLRLDAVHAILDDSARHLLEELAERVRAAAPGRHIHLVLENEENQASRLTWQEDGRPRWYNAQWNDDVHHVLHVAASGEANGYYADYHGDTEKLGRSLAEGFAFQGEMMPYRGEPRGEPSRDLPPLSFVAFIQNHDQVGNRAFGDRLSAFAPSEAVRAVAAVYLLLPQVPMLFMGEEWAAAQPFPFFCDFGPELAEAVRNGRRNEFARFPEFQAPEMRARIPDPTSPETFASAKLHWDDLSREPHAAWLDWYRQVLRARKAEIVPRLTRIMTGGRYEVVGAGAVVVRWPIADGGETLTMAANLSARPVSGFPPADERVIWTEGQAAPDKTFGPWTVRWSIEQPAGRARQDDKDAAGSIAALAERMGIESEFRNARGDMVLTTEETNLSLLAAMGLPVDGEAQAHDALDRLNHAEWQQALPPVAVLRADEGNASIILTLPADAGEIVWQLHLEDGEQRSGKLLFESLPLVEEKRIDRTDYQRRRLPLRDALPWGYHRLTVEPGDGAATLVVSPGRCWLPADLDRGGRLWGIAAQLYLLRSQTDWGIGDYGDLTRLVRIAGAEGADVIGLNPLHAMFLDRPENASPYSPASRLLLNALNIDVAAVPELADCPEAGAMMADPEFASELARCRAAHHVDYTAVTSLKLRVLQAVFDHAALKRGARWEQFDAFRREQGETLRRGCLFLAMRHHFTASEPPLANWRDWPEVFRDPASPAVAQFAREHSGEIDFLAWLQWVADEQLAGAATACREAGMAVGLYRDLAVGADSAGAETWANAAAVVSSAQVGAPPDIHNPAGQNWGLPPFHPHALQSEAYRSFIDLVRANMRHSGGLRIDHVMGLQHLYWIPVGQPPPNGAYISYPLDDLIGIIALESHRQQCLVVGEDLGTVPHGFRENMEAANILSYRVLYFEQEPDSGAFILADAYPRTALAVIGSHDLPTLKGWWDGEDLRIKQALGLLPDANGAARLREQRAHDRDLLLQAFRREGLIETGGEPSPEVLLRAAHAFLARTPSVLAMAQIDDLMGEQEPVNIPGTSYEYPNWRRRQSMTLDEMASSPRFKDIAKILLDLRNKTRG